MPASVVLVIDASVGCSAGGDPAAPAPSGPSSDILEAVLAICHRAAFTPELWGEWRKHESKYGQKWRASMTARRKIVRPDTNAFVALEDLVLNTLPATEHAEAGKDFHLIAGALATGKIVVSGDKKAMRRFARCAVTVHALGGIVWGTPSVQEDALLDWIKQGAKTDKGRTRPRTLEERASSRR